jgi:DNA polymerase-3 subunit delta'
MKEKKKLPLIGYSTILERFNQLIEQQSFCPVNLIYGAEGSGKRLFCEKLAANLLDFSNSSYSNLATHPDLLIIEASPDSVRQEITIDLTRKIKKFLALTPAQAKCQIVIIDNIESLNINAANSILKILEEPQNNKYFLLISHNLNLVLNTIISRCKKTFLPSLSKDNFYQILQAQNITNLEITDIDLLYKLFPLQPGKALKFFHYNGLDNLTRIKEVIVKNNFLTSKEFANNYDSKDLNSFKNFFIIIEYLSYEKFNFLQQEQDIEMITKLNNFLEKFRNRFFDTIKLNLDRKNFIINIIEDFIK